MRFPRALHVDYHTAAILEWVEGRLRAAAATAAAQAEDAAAPTDGTPRLVVPWRSSGACDSDDEEDEDDEIVIVEDGAPILRGDALAGAAGRGARDNPLALSDDDAGAPAAEMEPELAAASGTRGATTIAGPDVRVPDADEPDSYAKRDDDDTTSLYLQDLGANRLSTGAPSDDAPLHMTAAATGPRNRRPKRRHADLQDTGRATLVRVLVLLSRSRNQSRLADAPWHEDLRRQSRAAPMPLLPWVAPLAARSARAMVGAVIPRRKLLPTTHEDSPAHKKPRRTLDEDSELHDAPSPPPAPRADPWVVAPPVPFPHCTTPERAAAVPYHPDTGFPQGPGESGGRRHAAARSQFQDLLDVAQRSGSPLLGPPPPSPLAPAPPTADPAPASNGAAVPPDPTRRQRRHDDPPEVEPERAVSGEVADWHSHSGSPEAASDPGDVDPADPPIPTWEESPAEDAVDLTDAAASVAADNLFEVVEPTHEEAQASMGVTAAGKGVSFSNVVNVRNSSDHQGRRPLEDTSASYEDRLRQHQEKRRAAKAHKARKRERKAKKKQERANAVKQLPKRDDGPRMEPEITEPEQPSLLESQLVNRPVNTARIREAREKMRLCEERRRKAEESSSEEPSSIQQVMTSGELQTTSRTARDMPAVSLRQRILSSTRHVSLTVSVTEVTQSISRQMSHPHPLGTLTSNKQFLAVTTNIPPQHAPKPNPPVMLASRQSETVLVHKPNILTARSSGQVINQVQYDMAPHISRVVQQAFSRVPGGGTGDDTFPPRNADLNQGSDMSKHGRSGSPGLPPAESHASLSVSDHLVAKVMNKQSSVPRESETREIPPIRVLCSETFLDTWPELIAELSSGRWRALAKENTQVQSFETGSEILGRKIELVDSSILNESGVDFELPNRGAGIVHSASAFEVETDAKKLVMDLAHLVAEGKYRCIHIIICLDSQLTEPVMHRLTNLAATGLASGGCALSTYTRLKLSDPLSMAASLGLTVIAATRCTAEPSPVDSANDPEIVDKAKFIQAAAHTLTASGSIQCLQLARKLAPDIPIFPYFLESDVIRQEIIRLSNPNSSQLLATEIDPCALEELQKTLQQTHSFDMSLPKKI